MNSKVLYSIFLIFIALFQNLNAQNFKKDIGVFKEYKNTFWDSIESVTNKFIEEEEKPEIRFYMNFSDKDLPDSQQEFTKVWFHPPISQGNSNTCWCFSTTSFFESEIYRLSKRKIKLSEMYTVYWEYVEKARRFVGQRGNSNFCEGSEADVLQMIWKKYGIVPADAYTGLKSGQIFHDHRALFIEMTAYLEFVREENIWNEEVVITTIKSMLNHYLGEPPKQIEVDGKNYTPLQYLDQICKLKLDDYVVFLSLKEKPYYQKVEYVVPDNWWHSAEYYNVPLEVFMSIFKRAINNNYSMSLGGDTSEPGYYAYQDVAMVPSFDIPADYIDENARQLRFSNESTTDDHGIHVVGYLEKNGKDWYLIKDSGSSSRIGAHPGYYFYHEDYVKLKMMDFMVHRSVAEDVLKKF